ncbi:MAG TPA: hypothetical protein VK503_09565 [Candidatus Bathyarchaeia archaeon]|nr:hypothetical protein [Candidatus Bathyarchaeia archaeon]
MSPKKVISSLGEHKIHLRSHLKEIAGEASPSQIILHHKICQQLINPIGGNFFSIEIGTHCPLI